ncbi:WD repeat-containing protein 62-like isoform X1 [Acipenser ruthenus]|uniref:WD repeat-containing protein 62-like isoform X1 n=1 Tax=Acipenser ruthenus TaxID=7906 RepID=UPI00155FDB13|nr:WD repeat-containing protein 62-like isoform X1 [Acipenser ruthenus]
MAEGVFGGFNNSLLNGNNLNYNNTNTRGKKLLNPAPALNLRRKTRQQQLGRNIHSRVTLERVLGVTALSGSGLACDSTTGLVAYPAGCVVVLLNPKKNKQSHILNASRKTFTALAFSQDGKYLVTGESGHMPAVRVWDVEEKTQVAEVQCHKYGVSCVAFSANSSYIVSVGYQHDMTVNVWQWKKGTVIASNKVSSKVTAVCFSEDSSYFVTVGNRHAKFWYLDASKERRINSTVPLIGRSGILGEQRNKMFCGVACGKGRMASSTFCITSSGLLCQFNENRLLDTWIDLKAPVSNCIVASEDFVFCGCADGTIRVFNPHDLHYITSLPKPHHLGVDVAKGTEPGHLFDQNPDAVYPDALALAFDPSTRWLSCVYSDHSLYVWDVRDLRKVGKVNSALYHSGCVWSVETYPELEERSRACLPAGSFLTCSSDNTIRLWNMDGSSAATGISVTGFHKNFYSHNLLKVVYVGNNIQHLQDTAEKADCTDLKAGIRVLAVSPDGQHLASGDRSGNLRIYDLQFLDELMNVEAHDSEVLCLEYSKPETGMSLLATASRDRLIHVLNVDKQYGLEQTLDDHSASITAVKFTGDGSRVRMISCGADKSIYFRTAEKSAGGINFSRTHHVVGKTTLYDMDIDATRKYAAIGCQDRNIRIYDIDSGKQNKCFKGSQSEDGTLLKVQMDRSGMFLATSSSDKNISIFDFYTGECVATVFGHSEIVTAMRFSNDCKHLITVSGDSCVFIWRLNSQMTNCMRKRLAEIKQVCGQQRALQQHAQIRRETYITVPHGGATDEEEEEDGREEDLEEEVSLQTPVKDSSNQDLMDPIFLQTNGRLPLWAKRMVENPEDDGRERRHSNQYQPQGRWAERANQEQIKTLLDTRYLQMCLTPSPQREGFEPQSLDSLLGQEEDDDEMMMEEEFVHEHQLSQPLARPRFLQLTDPEEIFGQDLDSPETSEDILYPANSTVASLAGDGDFDVKELCRGPSHKARRWGRGGSQENSPDSAYCVGSAGSQASSQEQPRDDVDSLSQLSSAGSSGVEEEEEEPCLSWDTPVMLTPDQEEMLWHRFDTLADDLTNEKFDTNLKDLKPSSDDIFLNPRLSISARFLSRCQNKLRRLGAALPPKILLSALKVPEEEQSSKPHSDPKRQGEAILKTVSDESSSESAAKKELKPRVRRRSSSFNCKPQKPNPKRMTIAVTQRDDPQLGALFSAQDSNSSPRRRSLPSHIKEVPVAKPGRQSYMGTTASSRAKTAMMSRSVSMGENLNSKSAEEQHGSEFYPNGRATSTVDLSTNQQEALLSREQAFKENLNPGTVSGNHQARAGLRLDLSSSSDRILMPPPPVHKPSLSLVTPTEMRSLGKEGKSYISDILESIVPAPPSPVKKRTPCPPSDPEPQQVLPGREEPPASTTQVSGSSAELQRPRTPCQEERKEAADPDSTDVPMSIQICKQVVNELQNTLKRALCLYSKVVTCNESPEQQVQMKAILADAFSSVQRDIDSVESGKSGHSAPHRPEATPSPTRQLKDERTMALLERYSEMLLQITEKKLDSNS